MSESVNKITERLADFALRHGSHRRLVDAEHSNMDSCPAANRGPALNP
jgi:hypothetical protein